MAQAPTWCVCKHNKKTEHNDTLTRLRRITVFRRNPQTESQRREIATQFVTKWQLKEAAEDRQQWQFVNGKYEY